jgi:hypothetical protein
MSRSSKSPPNHTHIVIYSADLTHSKPQACTASLLRTLQHHWHIKRLTACVKSQGSKQSQPGVIYTMGLRTNTLHARTHACTHKEQQQHRAAPNNNGVRNEQVKQKWHTRTQQTHNNGQLINLTWAQTHTLTHTHTHMHTHAQQQWQWQKGAPNSIAVRLELVIK